MTHGKDILFNESFDLQIASGDFVTGPSDAQNVQVIFLAHPGEIKAYPLMGFGASKYLKTRVSKAKFYRDLKIQLKYDGYENPEIKNGIEKISISV